MPFAGVLTKQIRAAGWNVRLLGWGGFLGSDFGEFAGADANGMVMGDSSHWKRVYARKKGKAFVDAFRKRFGRPPNANELVGADALGIAVAGIKKAGSTDGEKIQKAIHGMGYNGIRLFYQWRPDGNLKRHPIVAVRWQNKDLQLLSTDIFKKQKRK